FTRAYSDAGWVQGFLKRDDLITKEAQEIAELISQLRTLSFIDMEVSLLERLKKIMDTLKQAQEKGLDMDEIMGAGAQQGWQVLLDTLTAKVTEMQQIETFIGKAKGQVDQYGNDVAQTLARANRTQQDMLTNIQNTLSRAEQTIQQAQSEWGTAEQKATQRLLSELHVQRTLLERQLNEWEATKEAGLNTQFQQFTAGITERAKKVDEFSTAFEQLKNEVGASVSQSTSDVETRLKELAQQTTLAEIYRNRLTIANAQRSTPPTAHDINALATILRECPASVWKSSGIYNDWLQSMRGIEASIPDAQKRKKIDPKQKDGVTYETFLADLKGEADVKGSSQPNAPLRKPQLGSR
ncbi:MAG: hypothetical protein ACOYLB_17625, partial [Phototrophicaceae bacterium]